MSCWASKTGWLSEYHRHGHDQQFGLPLFFCDWDGHCTLSCIPWFSVLSVLTLVLDSRPLSSVSPSFSFHSLPFFLSRRLFPRQSGSLVLYRLQQRFVLDFFLPAGLSAQFISQPTWSFVLIAPSRRLCFLALLFFPPSFLQTLVLPRFLLLQRKDNNHDILFTDWITTADEANSTHSRIRTHTSQISSTSHCDIPKLYPDYSSLSSFSSSRTIDSTSCSIARPLLRQ